jgi:hypothetical protein
MFRDTLHMPIRLAVLLWWACLLAAVPAGPGHADRFSDRGPMLREAALPLVALRASRPAPRGSLFAGRDTGGLFAPLPGQDLRDREGPRGAGPGATVRARLRDLIARAEAGPAGYDAVQHGAHRPPPRRPTQMTLREVFHWIDATPGQHHAIGRYQIIPATLRRLVARAGIDPDKRFAPRIQDRLADMLLEDAGLDAVHRGEMPRAVFRLNLARVWAGLPTATGLSYYHGVAGNRAVIGYDVYRRAVDDILGG